MSKLKISELLKETGAFVFTYSEGVLFTKEGELLKDEKKQKLFGKILDEFERKEEMFEYLSDARKHLNSPKPSVGFYVNELENGKIQIMRLYFLIGISTHVVEMGRIDYNKFFNEFIDLEGKELLVKYP